MTLEDKTYIRSHYHNTPVLQLAKTLKRGAATIYAFMEQENLSPFKTEYRRPGTHPFRQMNRNLERELEGFRSTTTSKKRSQRLTHSTK